MRPRLTKQSHTHVGAPLCTEKQGRVQSLLCWRRIDTVSRARCRPGQQYDWWLPRRSPCQKRRLQQHQEWKRCAVILALVAEQAVRVSADPYGAPNPPSSTAPSGVCLRQTTLQCEFLLASLV